MSSAARQAQFAGRKICRLKLRELSHADLFRHCSGEKLAGQIKVECCSSMNDRPAFKISARSASAAESARALFR